MKKLTSEEIAKKQEEEKQTKIHKGDLVSICFGRASPEFNCIVVYIPCATGDSWILKRKDGTIFYAQHFEKMEKITKKEDE
jgi:IS4 transposase